MLHKSCLHLDLYGLLPFFYRKKNYSVNEFKFYSEQFLQISFKIIANDFFSTVKKRIKSKPFFKNFARISVN